MVMGTLYPPNVENNKPTICGLPNSSRFVMRYDMSEAPFFTIGQRLEAIRTGFSSLNQKDWALKHNFQPTQWNNWEKGARRITVPEAEKLSEIYGVTLDFIYRGRRDGLSEIASKVV